MARNPNFRFKVSDLAVHDCNMPYPNTIYRVEEVDEHGNFRGRAVFRLTCHSGAYPTKKSQWFGRESFRPIRKSELTVLINMLQRLAQESPE